MSKYFLGWDRDNRVIQILGAVLIILAVVSICIDAFTSAHWGTPVAGGCAALLAILTVVTFEPAGHQAGEAELTRRKEVPENGSYRVVVRPRSPANDGN